MQKTILLICAVLIGQSVLRADKKPLIADPIVRDAICENLKIPHGKFAPPVKLTEADLAKVTFLDLSDTKITDAGLKEIVKCKQLNALHLWGTNITDAGLSEVAKLQKLDILRLSFNYNITVVGLKEVAKLQKLEVLWMTDTQITDAGVAELKKAMPKCQIFSKPKK